MARRQWLQDKDDVKIGRTGCHHSHCSTYLIMIIFIVELMIYSWKLNLVRFKTNFEPSGFFSSLTIQGFPTFWRKHVVEVTPYIIPTSPVVHHNFGTIGLYNIKKKILKKLEELGTLCPALAANVET